MFVCSLSQLSAYFWCSIKPPGKLLSCIFTCCRKVCVSSACGEISSLINSKLAGSSGDPTSNVKCRFKVRFLDFDLDRDVLCLRLWTDSHLLVLPSGFSFCLLEEVLAAKPPIYFLCRCFVELLFEGVARLFERFWISCNGFEFLFAFANFSVWLNLIRFAWFTGVMPVALFLTDLDPFPIRKCLVVGY